MQDLIVTLIQTELFWEDATANLSMFDAKIDAIEEKTHLIVLPEMFTTGFSMNAADLAQSMDDAAVNWIRSKAQQKKTHITGSIMIRDSGKYYNRLVWAEPGGTFHTYDKKHLFRYAGEEKIYTAGNEKITVRVAGWRIRPFTCYDLRFPLWTRNFDNAYDVALFVANWPEKRSAHWKALLPARAIENQAYVVGVNRVGKDGNGFAYSGDSAVIDPLGRVLFEKSHLACVHCQELSRNVLDTYRQNFPAWRDADADLCRG